MRSSWKNPKYGAQAQHSRGFVAVDQPDTINYYNLIAPSLQCTKTGEPCLTCSTPLYMVMNRLKPGSFAKILVSYPQEPLLDFAQGTPSLCSGAYFNYTAACQALQKFYLCFLREGKLCWNLTCSWQVAHAPSSNYHHITRHLKTR